MQPTYTNSKGQQVVIADMELPHLLNSLSANSRCIGIGDIDDITIEQKTNEVKHMHADILRRFEEANSLHKLFERLVVSILESESDTFNATDIEVTRKEAEVIAMQFFGDMVVNLTDTQTVELVLDGSKLSEMLDDIREND